MQTINDIIVSANQLNNDLIEYQERSLNRVITYTTDLNDLELQYNRFFEMPKPRRKESDDMSILLTGMSNIDRYNIIKGILHNTNDKDVYTENTTEDIKNTHMSGKDNEHDDPIRKPIEFSYELIGMAHAWEVESNIKMVYPCDDINAKFAEFDSQPHNLKKDADMQCTELFGMNCTELYKLCKFQPFAYTGRDDSSDYALSMNLEAFDTSKSSIYELYQMVKIRKLLDERENLNNKIHWSYIYSPYLSPKEVRLYTEGNESINEEYYKLFEEYEKAYYGMINEFDSVKWSETVKAVMLKEDSEQKELDLLTLGWNPAIEFDADGITAAYDRINDMINKEFNGVKIIDSSGCYDKVNMNEDFGLMESMKPGYYAVHIVLVKGSAWFSDVISKFSDGPFSHSCICIDNDFKRLYSYNMDAKNKASTNGNGFSLESISNFPKDNRLAIYTIFVDKDQYDAIEHNIQQMVLYQNKTSYSMLNIMTILFKNISINMDAKMICSQFVDKMLKLANIDITNMPSDKVTPNTFYNVSLINTNIYKIYDGLVKDFDPKRAEKLVEKMSRQAKKINEFMIINPTDHYLKPMIINEIKAPLVIKSNGDILLTKPLSKLDLDAEYTNSHKLLLNYNETNNYEGMKYELCRLYYMNYLLEKRIAMNKKTKDINTRARVLNDFNKYLKVVLRNQTKFNFSEYYEQSPFYHNTLEVDGGTIKYTNDKLKQILSLML